MTYIRPNDKLLMDCNYPSGAGGTNKITLVSSGTAYALPNPAVTKSFVLIIYNGSDTDMYWGFNSITSDGILLPSGATASINLGANQQIYVYCASTGKIINYSYKEIE